MGVCVCVCVCMCVRAYVSVSLLVGGYMHMICVQVYE